MFQILALAFKQQLHYADAKQHVSEAIGEDWLTNTEGNNTENKLKADGVNVDKWPGQ